MHILIFTGLALGAMVSGKKRLAFISHVFNRLKAQWLTGFIFIFFIALAIRLIYMAFHPDLNFGVNSVFGVPFSDAMSWHRLAVDISHGQGMTGWFSAQRPGYPIFLACFYSWFGASFELARVLNIICASLGIALAFVVIKKALGKSVAFFAALAFALSINQAAWSQVIITEPLGMVLFVAALWFVMEAGDRQRSGLCFLAGIFLGLSNLARPLTMPAVFGLSLYLAWIWKKKGLGYKKAVAVALIFILGAFIIMVPWFLRQKKVHGIWSVSNKMPLPILAACTPGQKNWSVEVDRPFMDTWAKGVLAVYNAVERSALENIKKNPGAYAKNACNAFWEYLNSIKQCRGFEQTALAGLLLWLFFISIRTCQLKTSLALLALCCTLLVLEKCIPPNFTGLVVVFGMATALFKADNALTGHGAWYRIKNPRSLALLAGLIFTGLALALIGGGLENRLFMFYGWLFLSFYLYAFFAAFLWIRDRIAPYVPTRPVPPDHGKSRNKKIAAMSKFSAIVVLLFFTASLARLGYANYFADMPPKPKFQDIEAREKAQIVAVVSGMCPEILSPDNAKGLNDFAVAVPFSQDMWNFGKVSIARGVVSPYIYHVPANSQAPDPAVCGLFDKRPYERTVYFSQGPGFFVFPGKPKKETKGREFIFVGLHYTDTLCVYEGRNVVEGLCMIPVDSATGKPVYSRAIWARNPGHKRVLKQLQNKRMAFAKTDKTILDLSARIIKNGENPALHHNLARLYGQKQDWDNASIHYNCALGLKPDFFSAVHGLGTVYLRTNSPAMAVKMFLKAHELRPKSIAPAYNLACSYSKSRKLKQAAYWLDKAVELGFNDWDALKKDEDLKNIRGDLYFQKLINMGHLQKSW